MSIRSWSFDVYHFTMTHTNTHKHTWLSCRLSNNKNQLHCRTTSNKNRETKNISRNGSDYPKMELDNNNICLHIWGKRWLFGLKLIQRCMKNCWEDHNINTLDVVSQTYITFGDIFLFLKTSSIFCISCHLSTLGWHRQFNPPSWTKMTRV